MVDLVVEVGVEPAKGLGERGKEMARKEGGEGDSDFWNTFGMWVGLLGVVGAGVSAIWLMKAGGMARIAKGKM